MPKKIPTKKGIGAKRAMLKGRPLTKRDKAVRAMLRAKSRKNKK